MIVPCVTALPALRVSRHTQHVVGTTPFALALACQLAGVRVAREAIGPGWRVCESANIVNRSTDS